MNRHSFRDQNEISLPKATKSGLNERAPFGVNTLGNMMKEISTAAKLSQIYTNHSVRAISVTLLDRAGIPVHRIMQLSGHRNEASVKVY